MTSKQPLVGRNGMLPRLRQTHFSPVFVSRLGGLSRNFSCAGQLHRLSERFGQVSMRRTISSPFSFVIALGEYSMSPNAFTEFGDVAASIRGSDPGFPVWDCSG